MLDFVMTLRRWLSVMLWSVARILPLSMAALPPCHAAQPRLAPQLLPTAETKVELMKIRLTVNDKVMIASLEDSAAGRDFKALLPLTLTLSDYASTEKISDLPRKLSTQGAPAGVDPDVGDITYYAPWGNLAIFYKDFGYANGLVRLGRIESGLDALKASGPLQVHIEVLKQ